jgi:hypothetical protein
MARFELFVAKLTLSFAALVLDRTANAQSCPPGSQLATVTVPGSIASTTPPFTNVILPVPKFHAGPGQTLIEADIAAVAVVTGSVQAENLSTGPCEWSWCLGGAIQIAVPLPNTSRLTLGPHLCGTDQLGPFDGTLDYRGTSGVTHSNLSAEGQTSLTINDGNVLVQYLTGTGTINFSISALPASTHSGCGNLAAILTNSDAITISITYTYCSPGADMCVPGRAGVIACPCSNAQLPPGSTRGCNNSAGSGGAVLGSGGQALLSADTVVFNTAGELPSATSIVLQGDALVSTGTVFGQGVRCAGGVLTRLYAKTASGGSIVAPQSGDPSVSARSAARGDTINPGETRWYVVYYRDPTVLGGCSSTSTFNATQGQAILWSM